MKTNIPTYVLVSIQSLLTPFLGNIPIEYLRNSLLNNSDNSSLDPGLKPQEFCNLLGISKQSLWNWEKAGKIKLTRVNHTVRIPYHEAQRIINGED